MIELSKNMEEKRSVINSNFRIKVFGRDDSGKKIDTLVGVSGLVGLVGNEFAEKFSVKAMKSIEDKCTFKLRRGIKVTFYVR